MIFLASTVLSPPIREKGNAYSALSQLDPVFLSISTPAIPWTDLQQLIQKQIIQIAEQLDRTQIAPSAHSIKRKHSTFFLGFSAACVGAAVCPWESRTGSLASGLSPPLRHSLSARGPVRCGLDLRGARSPPCAESVLASANSVQRFSLLTRRRNYCLHLARQGNCRLHQTHRGLPVRHSQPPDSSIPPRFSQRGK